MPENISVHELAVGQQGEIIDLLGQSESVVRLGEIGLHAGASLTMMCAGATCIVRLGGSKLCLRTVDVDVRVRPDEPSRR